MSARMRSSQVRLTHRGFTLIEAMIAMTFLAIGLLGTFMGLVHAANMAREGQLRQYKMELIDAKLQRLLLADKTALPNMVGGLQTLSPDTLIPSDVKVGDSPTPWVIDPSTVPLGSSTAAMPGDLGIGAVFQVRPDGEIRPVEGNFPSCTDATVPNGAYCREVLLQRGIPLPSTVNAQIQGLINATGAQSSTLWIRVSRKGENRELAVVERKVLVL